MVVIAAVQGIKEYQKYDRNFKTGAQLGGTTELVTAEQYIYHATDHLAAVVLLVIARDSALHPYPLAQVSETLCQD